MRWPRRPCAAGSCAAPTAHVSGVSPATARTAPAWRMIARQVDSGQSGEFGWAGDLPNRSPSAAPAQAHPIRAPAVSLAVPGRLSRARTSCQAGGGREPVEQSGRELGIPPVDIAEALIPQRKRSAVIGGEPDDHREGLVPTEIIIAGMPPGILLMAGDSSTEPSNRAWPSLPPGAAGQPAGVSRSRENHDLRGADGPHTRHREAAGV